MFFEFYKIKWMRNNIIYNRFCESVYKVFVNDRDVILLYIFFKIDLKKGNSCLVDSNSGNKNL